MNVESLLQLKMTPIVDDITCNSVLCIGVKGVWWAEWMVCKSNDEYVSMSRIVLRRFIEIIYQYRIDQEIRIIIKI